MKTIEEIKEYIKFKIYFKSGTFFSLEELIIINNELNIGDKNGNKNI